MKIKIILPTFILGMLLVSCSEKEKWPEKTRIEHIENCTLSFIETFEAGLGDLMSEVNKEKLDKLAETNCSCIYESMKINYDSAEEAFKHTTDEIIANSTHCEATAAQIDDLLVK